MPAQRAITTASRRLLTHARQVPCMTHGVLAGQPCTPTRGTCPDRLTALLDADVAAQMANLRPGHRSWSADFLAWTAEGEWPTLPELLIHPEPSAEDLDWQYKQSRHMPVA